MKKIMSFMLSVIVLACTLNIPCTAYYYEETKAWDRFEYFIDDHMSTVGGTGGRKGTTLCITRYYSDLGDKLVVPDEINGVKIKNVILGDYSNIKTLVLSDGIEGVGCWDRTLVDEHENLKKRAENPIKNLYVGKNFAVDGFYAIQSDDFSKFENLKNVYVSEENPNLTVYDGVVFSKDLKKVIFCPDKRFTKKDSTFELPKNKVEVIGRYAFSGTRLAKIKNVMNLKEIEIDAFSATKLEKFNVGKKVEYIHGAAFKKCTKLKKVVFYSRGNTLKKIYAFAFGSCESLKTVYMRKLNKVPKLAKSSPFYNTKSGIKFYVKNKKVAKQLKKEMTRYKQIGVKKAKIYVGKKLVYKNVK